MNKFLIQLVLSSLVTGAPQYGGVQTTPATAPLRGHGSVQCRTEYATIWDTEYTETETEVCTTEYEKICRTETQRLCQATTRQECSTVYEKKCQTVYRNECIQQFKTEYQPYTETECSTEYKEDCEYQWEGHGNDKVWAPIAGTCKRNPYQTCSDVTKSKAVQVPYPVCRDVPEQKCSDVPRQQCVQVPDQICTNQPLEKCQDVPRQACQQIHKKVPNRVSRRVPRKVCDDGHVGVATGAPEEFDVTGVATAPPLVGAGPEVVDVRHKTGQAAKNVNFNQIAATPRKADAVVFKA